MWSAQNAATNIGLSMKNQSVLSVDARMWWGFYLKEMKRHLVNQPLQNIIKGVYRCW